MCGWGAVGPKGNPTQKAMKFVSNNRGLLNSVLKRCDGSHVHEVIQGHATSKSAHYPVAMVQSLLKQIVTLALERDSSRFLFANPRKKHAWVPNVAFTTWAAPSLTIDDNEVLFLDINKDVSAWSELL